MHNVKTQQFEGPLDLLLELIENQKMDITKVSLAQVADDFLSQVDSGQDIKLENLSEFLLIASQLILLKSKALLPLFEFSVEEEEEIEDLAGRLREYKKIKNSSKKIGVVYHSKKTSFSKKEEKIKKIGFIDPKISVNQLRDIFSAQLISLPTRNDLAEEVLEEVMSLEDKIEELRDSIESRMKVAFHETIDQASDKVDVVVTFLAMLEMIKQKVISAHQLELFGEITIEKKIKIQKQENIK